MIKLLALLTALVLTGSASAHAATVTVWQLYTHTSNWTYGATNAPAQGSDLADFAFPTSAPNASFLTTTSVPSLLGDLSGKTLSATVTISPTSGTPTFTYDGEGSSWNPCATPAFGRLYFSTSSSAYNLTQSSSANGETKYWWSHPGAWTLSAGTVTVSDSLTGADWSDGNGHLGSDPAYASAFASAVSHVKQVGLSFGGGCFFDVGVGVVNGSGTATLGLQGFTAS